MLRNIILAIALALCASQLCTGQNGKKSLHSEHTGYDASIDNRGIQDRPLEVNTHSIQSSAEAAQQSKQIAKQDHFNDWTIGLTIAIAVCALFQVLGILGQIFVYLRQTRIMKETLAAIDSQAITMRTQAQDARDAAKSSSATTQSTLDAIVRQAKAMEEQLEEMRVQRKQTANDMGKQSYEISQQTGAIYDSVKAAVAHAKATSDTLAAMKSKERGRLSIEIGKLEFGSLPNVKYKLSCYGTTPAYLTGSWQSVTVIPMFDPPWTERDFGMKIRELASVISTGEYEREQWIYCESGSLLTGYKDVEDAVQRGDSWVQFRMWISYTDIFGDKDTLFVSKMYGVKPKFNADLYGNLGMLAGLYTVPEYISQYPNWYDSRYPMPELEAV